HSFAAHLFSFYAQILSSLIIYSHSILRYTPLTSATHTHCSATLTLATLNSPQPHSRLCSATLTASVLSTIYTLFNEQTHFLLGLTDISCSFLFIAGNLCEFYVFLLSMRTSDLVLRALLNCRFKWKFRQWINSIFS
ncbi:unnamed protein product, partial [Lymnaea stagnalis]